MKSATALVHSAPVVLAALALPPTDAMWCDSIGSNAPEVTTLMASMTNPAREAWLVTPQCKVQPFGVIAASTGILFNLIDGDSSLERVVGIPTDVTKLAIPGYPSLKSIDFSSARNLKNIALIQSGGKTLDLVLPTGCETFEYLEGSLESLDNINFPAGMTTLKVVRTGIRSLRNVKLPARLKELNMYSNRLTSIDFSFPSALETVSLGGNPISKLDGLVLPTSMTSFECSNSSLTSVQGVRWPSSIRSIEVNYNPLTTFEIRESDVRTFESLTRFAAKVSQTSCKNSDAPPKTIQGVPLCVIDDDLFDSLYPLDGSPGPTSAPASKGSSSGSESNESDGNGLDQGGSLKASTNNGTDNTSTENASKASSSQREPTQGTIDATDAMKTESISATLMLVIGAVGSLLAVFLALVGYRVLCTNRRNRSSGGNNKYLDAETPKDTTTDQDDGVSSHPDDTPGINYSSSNEYLTNDVRNDKQLLPYRIERSEVQLGKVIARGGFGMVYRGKYDGRDVAIKQMLPDAWRNDTMLASFMDEIRLCASLDHPKIVQFVGITWSSLRDLSVLTEFMTGGDLYDLLYQPANGPRAQDWSQPWSTMTVSNLKCKTQMALDVAEAVVYLHSFESPIIHRDLKSKNVLLDGRGNPKLSDFGISREMVVDETMTSMIGTSAWIAPEVLRGERYTEKADIYSFGVLLVELDRCCHPYEGEPMLEIPQRWMQGVRRGATGGSTAESIVSRSAQIALLVSTGQLRPSLSPDAPPLIKTLASRCLVNDPEDRLTGMEVCYELRQITRGMKKLGAGAVGRL